MRALFLRDDADGGCRWYAGEFHIKGMNPDAEEIGVFGEEQGRDKQEFGSGQSL